jgi:hypothetical protein
MKQLKALIIIGGALVLGACSDGATAPSAATADATIPGGGANAALVSFDTLRFKFLIDAKRNITYPIGAGNSITFPKGSLCDPHSSYGPDQWDQPCAVAKGPLTVNAKAWLDASGHPRIDFDQHVRFVPSTDPRNWVVITFKDSRAAADFWTIGYCATETSTCVDESLTDPTLATYTDPTTGKLTRRIKHFSGYNVFAGFSDDASSLSSIAPDALLEALPFGAAARRYWAHQQRSGFMLAWG